MHQQYPFIFSSKKKYRIRRHLFFWTAWWLFAGLLYSSLTYVPQLGYLNNLLRSLAESLAFLPIHIVLAYSLIYFIIPYYLLKGKYWLAIVLVLISFSISALLSVVIANTAIGAIRALFNAENLPYTYVHAGFGYGFLAGLRGGITIGGLAAAIKLMKYWYVEGQRNLQLQKENIESQLQILKAQVHPHFLFNTLNNIYSYTQNTSQTASRLVMGLSDMLRYMLYECNQRLVPLSKELKMVEEYINLEKIRYGNKLEIHIDLTGNTQHFFISPLLLLPFIENCFKHGTSNVLEHPWMNLNISIEANYMIMKLLNSKPINMRSHKPGIGIENVRRRLELLYPNKYDLFIKNEEEIFIVNLKLELEKEQGFYKPVKQPSFIELTA